MDTRWTKGSDIRTASTQNNKLLGKKPAIFDRLGRPIHTIGMKYVPARHHLAKTSMGKARERLEGKTVPSK